MSISRSKSVSLSGKNMQPATSGTFQATVNLINGILGSGIAYLPFTLFQSGFGFSILVLFLVCIASCYVSIELIKMANLKKAKTLESLCQKTYGKPLYYICCIACIFFSFGALISYIQLIYKLSKNLITQLSISTTQSPSFYYWVPIGITLGIFFFIITPLSLLKDLSKLSFASTLSVIIFGAIMVMTIVQAIIVGQPRPYNSYDFIKIERFFSSIGGLSYSFVCTDMLMPVYLSMKYKTEKNWAIVTFSALGFLGVLYGAFSVICYALINDLNEIVFLSSSLKSVVISVSQALFGITIILTYPVVLFVCRSYIFPLFVHFLGPVNRMTSRNFNILYYSTTFALLLITLILGLLIPNISYVLDLTGLIASNLLGFIIPNLIIFKVKGFNNMFSEFKSGFTENENFSKRFKKIINFFVPVLIISVGVFVGFAGSITYIISLTQQ